MNGEGSTPPHTFGVFLCNQGGFSILPPAFDMFDAKTRGGYIPPLPSISTQHNEVGREQGGFHPSLFIFDAF